LKRLFDISRVAISALLLICLASVTSAQPVTLRYETKSVARKDVVVMPFHAAKDSAFAGELPKTLRDLVDGDLAYCGYFNVTEPADLPPDTVTRIMRAGNSWDTLRTYSGSVAARVQGQVTVGWEGVTASVGIFQPPITGAAYSSDFKFKADDLRPAAHDIAEWVTKMLTGEEGSFTSRVAFVVKTGDSKNLWIMDWDGANPHSLTQDKTLNMSPTWAPDGNALYFTSFRAGNADIYRYDLASGRITSFIASPSLDSAPSVSPDGQWVAYCSSSEGNPEVYRVHPDGTGKQRLTFSYGVDTSPSWSPTSRELLFTSDRTGVPQIYRMDSEGASVQRITFVGNYNETARWSPRGDLIAYASREIGFQIFTISPDGSNERRVTGDGSNLDPSWSPDGMKLVYTSIRSNKASIWSCNWDGSDQRQLTFGMDATQPQWGPGAPAVATGK
jgi:TolB protein